MEFQVNEHEFDKLIARVSELLKPINEKDQNYMFQSQGMREG